MRLTLVATYAAVASGSASTYLGLRGELAAAVVVGLLALLALGIRLAWMTDWNPGQTAKRRAAVLATVMLVVTAVGGPVGTTAAQGTATPVCSILGVIGQLFVDGATCGESTEDKQTRLDLYAGAASQGQTGNSFQTQSNNLLTTSRSAAWTEGKIALVNSLNNNSTESEAEAAMREEIADYYSRVDHNIIQQSEAQIAYAEYARSVEQNETDNNGSWTHLDLGEQDTPENWDHQALHPTQEVNVTLVNGSTREISWWQMSGNGSGNGPFEAMYHPNASTSSYWDTGEEDCSNAPEPQVGVTPPCITSNSGNGSSITMFDGGSYHDRIEDAREQHDQLVANTDSYVSGVYSEYEAGDINTSDLLSPTELASRASTDYNSTGYYSFAGAELSALGVGGNLTTAVEVERNGSTYEGHLYSTGDGNQSWEAGESYQAGSGGNGVIYMASQNGSESDIRSWESGNFTLTNATNTQTGESVEVVNRTEYVYESTNSSALEEELNRTADLRAELEALEQQQGIGLPDIGLPEIGIPILALAVGAFLLLRRD